QRVNGALPVAALQQGQAQIGACRGVAGIKAHSFAKFFDRSRHASRSHQRQPQLFVENGQGRRRVDGLPVVPDRLRKEVRRHQLVPTGFIGDRALTATGITQSVRWQTLSSQDSDNGECCQTKQSYPPAASSGEAGGGTSCRSFDSVSWGHATNSSASF